MNVLSGYFLWLKWSYKEKLHVEKSGGQCGQPICRPSNGCCEAADRSSSGIAVATEASDLESAGFSTVISSGVEV